MKTPLVVLISASLLASFSYSAHASEAQKNRAFSIKYGASKLKTDVTGDQNFELYGRALSLDYTSESNKWTENKDLYLGYVASMDVHYNSKKKEDNHAIYQVEEVSSLTFNWAPKLSYMLSEKTALYTFAGLSYGVLKAQEYTKTNANTDALKDTVSGWGYLWGFGARYQLDNNFEFGGEVRANHLKVDNDARSGEADLYGFFLTAGYRF